MSDQGKGKLGWYGFTFMVLIAVIGWTEAIAVDSASVKRHGVDIKELQDWRLNESKKTERILVIVEGLARDRKTAE